MDLNDLASFVRVAELGTISAAAAALGVPKSTVTRRIARLEKQMGVELLRRSARSFAITDDGRLLHQRSSGAIRELMEAEKALSSSAETPHGRLVITAPDFGRSEAFAELIVAYRVRCPDVAVELRLENRVVDLIDEGVDVGIRAHPNNIPGSGELMARVFEMPPSGFYGSPDYIRRRGVPESPDELAEHDVVMHSSAVGRPITLFGSEKQTTITINTPAYQVNDSLFVRALAEFGAGLGSLPRFVASAAEQRGTLQRVLPEWSTRPLRISVVWPASRHLAPRVRAFVDLAQEFLGEGRMESAPKP
jgi:DNA-binding transcriptional LysR family regulator